MRDGKLLFSAVQFLMIAALFALGAAFFALHYSSIVRQQIAEWVMDPQMKFLLFGSLTCSVALLLTICFWAMQRASYVRIKMHDFSIQEPLIRKVIAKFWKEEFPEDVAPTEVYLANENIEIIVEDQAQDLEQIEKKISKLLSKQLGYEKKFFVSLTKR